MIMFSVMMMKYTQHNVIRHQGQPEGLECQVVPLTAAPPSLLENLSFVGVEAFM